MEYGVRSFKQSLGELARAVAGGGATRDAAYMKGANLASQFGVRDAQRRKYTAEAEGLEGQNAAMLGDELANSVGEIMRSAGRDPAAASAFAHMLRAGGGNASQLMSAIEGGVNLGRQGSAISGFADDPDLANMNLAASGRTPYKPFTQTAGGLMLNQATGEQGQDSPAALATIAADRALAGERGAQAQSHLGSAAAHQALAAQRTALTPTMVAENEAQAASSLGSAAASNALAAQRTALTPPMKEWWETRSPGGGRGAGGGAGGGGLKSSDVNAVRQLTASLFDSIYDPVSGQIRITDPTTRMRAHSIIARAEELMVEDGLGHAAAVQTAATEQGLAFPSAPGLGGAPSIGAPGGVSPSDPASIRNFLMQ